MKKLLLILCLLLVACGSSETIRNTWTIGEWDTTFITYSDCQDRTSGNYWANVTPFMIELEYKDEEDETRILQFTNLIITYEDDEVVEVAADSINWIDDNHQYSYSGFMHLLYRKKACSTNACLLKMAIFLTVDRYKLSSIGDLRCYYFTEYKFKGI